MAGKKITELNELTSVALSDVVAIVDDTTGTSITKKVSLGKLLSRIVVTKTSDYTAAEADSVLLVDTSGGAITVTLPTASGITGKEYTIKCIDATNTCTVDASGSETIDGNLTADLLANDSIQVVSDGSNWWII